MNTRALITLAAGAAITIPLLLAVARGAYLIAALLVAAVFFIVIFRNAEYWWMTAIATSGSGIFIVNSNASLHNLSTLSFVALCFLTVIMTQGRGSQNKSAVRRVTLYMIIITVVTASIRGWGLRFLGSSNWGGTQYIVILAMLSFFLFSFKITITEDQCWRTVMVLCVAGMLPSIDVFLRVVVPASGVFLQFFMGSSAAVEQVGDFGFGESRLQELQLPGLYAALLGLILYEQKRRHLSPMILICILLAIAFVGLSGHRTMVVLIGLTILIYAVFRTGHFSPSKFAPILGVMLVSAVILYIIAIYLPLPFQRALSVLPGIRVTQEAAMDARATSEWRIDMWRELVPMIPRYLLVGRGLGFDLMEAYAAYTLAADFRMHHFMIATHTYHNGPLWLLIDLGALGFLAGSVLMIGGTIRYRKLLAAIPPHSKWRSMYIVLFCYFSAYVVFFYTVIGNLGTFSRILIATSIMEVISSSVRKQQMNELSVDAAKSPPEPIQRPAAFTPRLSYGGSRNNWTSPRSFGPT